MDTERGLSHRSRCRGRALQAPLSSATMRVARRQGEASKVKGGLWPSERRRILRTMMGMPSFAERATQRKKWIAGVVVAAFSITAATVALTFWLTRTQRENQRSVPQALPPNVHQQLSGYSNTRSDEERRVFTVRAARTLALKDGGTTILEDVSVEIFGREGNRHDILRTGRCEYHPGSGDLFSSGPVQIELNASRQAAGTTVRARGGPGPVFFETSQVSFRQKGSMLATDQPVRFRIGTASGSAQGMTYATKAGWIELKKDIRAEWVPTAKGSDRLPVRLQAGYLRYESSQGEGGAATLTGPLEITQGGRRVSADRASLFLDARNRITRAMLEGHVRAAESSRTSEATVSAERVSAETDSSSGELKSIVAEGGVAAEALSKGRESSVSRLVGEHIEIHFRGAHPLPQSGKASGNARLTLDSVEQRALTASEIDFDFRPGRWDLREVRTAGAGELSMVPSGPGAGERVVSAGQLVIGLERGTRVRTLSGLSGTHVVFKPAPSAPPRSPVRESFSERLDAVFNPETRALSDMSQTGDFRFTDGERRATAERARYVSSTQVFEFEGRPRIEDDESRVSADQIVYDLRNDVAEGLGHVQSVHLAESGTPHSPPPLSAPALPESTAPEGGDSPWRTWPTHVLADRVVAQKRSQFAHYEGHVRAWHGSTLVEAAWLDVFRMGRRMSAGEPVSTSSLQPGTPGQGTDKHRVRERPSQPVLIRADRLEVVDSGARASYRGNVQLQSENTVLNADRAEVVFSRARAPELSGIERSRAEGHVRLVQPGRRATGERADYDAAAGKIVLSGGPPVLEDAKRGSTTGQRLTFFIRDDRLLIDGDVKSPVVSTHRIAQ